MARQLVRGPGVNFTLIALNDAESLRSGKRMGGGASGRNK